MKGLMRKKIEIQETQAVFLVFGHCTPASHSSPNGNEALGSICHIVWGFSLLWMMFLGVYTELKSPQSI